MELNIFEYSTSRPLLAQALNYRSLRQDLISSNIANINTPFYKPRDINFEDMLAQKSKEVFEKSSIKELEIAKTDNTHLEGNLDSATSQATIFYRDGHLARNDGNSVDIDTETSELSKNGVMYNAIIEAMKKQGSLFKTALEASSRLS